MTALVVAAVVFALMIAETAHSARNERALRRAGAVEARGDVYRVMQIAYPACFLAIAAEGWLRAPAAGPGSAFTAGACLFTLAKALKYWAIASLGWRWTFRVLVPPGAVNVASGPYRWLRHPNYVAVAGEIAGAALMSGAPLAGSVACAGFSLLMLARVRVEERALNAARR